MFSFKKYLEENTKKVDEMVSLTNYTYAVSPRIYTKNSNDEILQLNPNNFMASLMGSSSNLMSTTAVSICSELIDDKSIRESQYN